jgi:hypothetical protein
MEAGKTEVDKDYAISKQKNLKIWIHKEIRFPTKFLGTVLTEARGI